MGPSGACAVRKSRPCAQLRSAHPGPASPGPRAQRPRPKVSARVPVVPQYPGFLRSFPGISGVGWQQGRLRQVQGRSNFQIREGAPGAGPTLRCALARKLRSRRTPRRGKGREKGDCPREGNLARVPQPSPPPRPGPPRVGARGRVPCGSENPWGQQDSSAAPAPAAPSGKVAL